MSDSILDGLPPRPPATLHDPAEVLDLVVGLARLVQDIDERLAALEQRLPAPPPEDPVRRNFLAWRAAVRTQELEMERRSL